MKLVAGMNSRYRQIVVVMTSDVGLWQDFRRDDVEIIPLGMTRGRPSLRGFFKASRALREFRPAIIQSWLYHADFMATLLAFGHKHDKLVWNVRCTDMELTQYARMTRWVRELLVSLSRIPIAIVSNSHRGIELHSSLGYRAREWILIGNGFDLDKFRPDPGLKRGFRQRIGAAERSRIIGMIARRDPMKDHKTLLAAAKIVLARRDDVMFYLCGADVPQLETQIEALGMRKNFFLEDARSDVETIYPGLDVFALSSAFGEGFPNVLGEAMSSGVPCVTTSVGDAPFIVAESGISVPPRKPEFLASAMMEALTWDSREYTSRSIAARRRIADHYSLRSVIAQYEALYLRLAGPYAP